MARFCRNKRHVYAFSALSDDQIPSKREAGYGSLTQDLMLADQFDRLPLGFIFANFHNRVLRFAAEV